ncbi:MAG: hypothetical protein Q9195_009128 [Heterodermia aff. obscurata]
MADEIIHKQEFNVVRDIKNIRLRYQPGSNQITIRGLTPTADENSIKVDGTGSATITDMTVELVPNSESFDEVYRSDSDDEDVDNSDEDEPDPENDRFKALVKKGRDIDEDLAKAKEEMHLGATQMSILTSFAESVTKPRPDDLSAFISTHRLERKKAYELVFESDKRVKALERQRHNNLREQVKVKKALRKAGRQATKLRAKEKKRKQRAREEREAGKRRLKEERVQFWPRKVYRVVVSLDTNSSFTPASSRRGSIDTIGKPVSDETSAGECYVSLSVSYITSCAAWTPRYDLSLNTKNNTGLIIYRAELSNTTSETWKDTKVILSTSQTASQGLGEPIPFMAPWHIGLDKKNKGKNDTTVGAILSLHERNCKTTAFPSSKQAGVSRPVLFGIGPVPVIQKPSGYQVFNQYMQPQMQAHGIMQAQQQRVQIQSQQQRAQMQSQAQRQGPAQQAQMAQLQQSGGAISDTAKGESEKAEEMAEGFAFADWEADTGATSPSMPALATLESAWSESGLTATYDLPGLRTIAPSHSARRQKIASVHLKDVHLSYLMVPKLRAAAFLKARIFNTSSVTLLRGPCGVTLDGSFLGNTTLPRCSAGDLFRLNLGVDPSVSVIYSKPVVRRNQTGVFQKEGSGTYTRTCTITNTNATRAVEGMVMEQVPVSEDERLRVEIVKPMGLCHEGDSRDAGTGLLGVGKVLEDWGKATATLRKAGEVWWDVRIEPGRGAQLVLEYEAKYPTTDVVVEV